jgi:hypothetical protein
MNEERPGGPIRIGDKEREDAVRRLGEHYEAGRLTAEEHSERVDQALQAKTADDLAALFSDLPRAQRAGAEPTGGGPWGWTKPPWTAPEGAAPSGPGRPPWAARGPLGKIPFPLLIGLLALGLILSIGCVVFGGHPPLLPLLLIGAAVLFARKRRQERRA